MYVGGAGGYSFYVRGGEQVIRQRKNNSNYGAGASRTYPQMIRRIKWGNLVNVFKAMKAWQPKAYDSKTKGQTDYNIFMQLNINAANAALTKEMCESGCAVIEGFQVSRGSLPPIALTNAQSGNQYVSDIKISNAISGSTTIGQLSADILANNPQFVEGDNLAFIFFKNYKTSRTEWPYVSTVYTEITLDTTSSVVVNSVASLDNRLSKSTGGYLQCSWSVSGEFDPNREVGFVLIHTRKSASMLSVSSQEILMNSQSLVAAYSGSEWYSSCISTYGLSDEVPLDPNFPEASISQVTANGSAVQNAQVLTGPQELIISGPSISTANLKVYANGVEYVRLGGDDNNSLYLLTANGSYQIYVNGYLYMTVFVTGITPPAGFPLEITAVQVPTTSVTINQDGAINKVILRDALCMNYPFVEDDVANYYLVSFQGVDYEQESFVLHNCEIKTVNHNESYTRLNLEVTDATEPAWVELEGSIVFVFNYQN